MIPALGWVTLPESNSNFRPSKLMGLVDEAFPFVTAMTAYFFVFVWDGFFIIYHGKSPFNRIPEKMGYIDRVEGFSMVEIPRGARNLAQRWRPALPINNFKSWKTQVWGVTLLMEEIPNNHPRWC